MTQLFHEHYDDALINQAVSSGVTSDSFNVSDSIGAAAQVDVTNATTLDIDVAVEASLDGITWFELETVNITGDITHLFVLADAFYDFLRVNITHTGGSADVVVKARAYTEA